ncbi:MAG TPA: isoprenylcysteine carboxylmethyltransferase family protein [Rhizomicrobium sp.]|jgi:protein-S-isoprenylcysteine O-methyltransferase Ste14
MTEKRFGSLASIPIALFATSLWLGLAIWGRGGFTAFFAHPARTALVVVTFALMAAAAFTQGNLSTGQQEDRANRPFLYLMLVIGTLDGWLPAYCDRVGIFVFGGDDVRWLGVALFAIGGVIRIVPVFVLDRRFSGLVAIQEGHRLVTGGIYGVIRNPSYLGLLISLFGWALAFRSWAGAALAVLFIPPLIVRMQSEERLLGKHFGAEYEAYRARTWRLIPWVY